MAANMLLFFRRGLGLFILLISFHSVLPIELSEQEQIGLEAFHELLPPPPNITKKIEKDLIAIRTLFPAVKDLYHTPPWVPGDLLLTGDELEVLKSINTTKIGVGEYETRELYPNQFLATFAKPYHPTELRLLLQREPGVLNPEPNRILGNQSTIRIQLYPRGDGGAYEYVFKRGEQLCLWDCLQDRRWSFQVSPVGEVKSKYAYWKFPPGEEVSEGQQIALEYSGELQFPPANNLAQRVELDLAGIRSAFPQVAGIANIPPKWNPGELILVDRDSRAVAKLNASKYGPVEILDVSDRDILIAILEKPYHPEVLGKVVESELGIRSKPNGMNGRVPGITLLNVTDSSGQGESIYYFKRGTVWSGCGSGCESWIFRVGPSGNVALLKEKRKGDPYEEDPPFPAVVKGLTRAPPVVPGELALTKEWLRLEALKNIETEQQNVALLKEKKEEKDPFGDEVEQGDLKN